MINTEDIDGNYNVNTLHIDEDIVMSFIENASIDGCDVVLEYFKTVQKIEQDWFDAVKRLDMEKAIDHQMKHSMFRTSFSDIAMKASGNMFVHEEQEA